MKKNDESGAIIVEAAIYFPIIIMVVGLIIIVSLAKLQQCLIMSTLVSATDIASMEAMDGENVSDELDNIDSFISSLSVVKGKNRILEIKNDGSMIKTINVKLSYSFEQPMFYKMLFKGSFLQWWSGKSENVGDITALSIDPRYVVDTMDQHILFNCNGVSFGNLMMKKYSKNLFTYLYQQYKR